MNIIKPLYKLGKAGLKALPTALSVGGAVGVVATGYSAAEAGIEQGRQEVTGEALTVREKAGLYAKPVITGAATIGCILTGDRLHVRRYAAMAGAATVLQREYDQLIRQARKTTCMTVEDDQVKARHKDIGHQVLKGQAYSENADIVWEHCKKNGIVPVDTHTGTGLWFEPISNQWFLASEPHVQQAEYHLNRNFRLRGDATFNEFLGFLQVDNDDLAFERLGWDEQLGETYYGYTWVDFLHRPKKLRDGTEYTEIFYPFEPHLSER